MNRPKVNDYFPEDTDVRGAIIEYNAAPHLFKYVQALDNYIDSLLTPPADVQEMAKELELFKRLWYNRNPVHENNADSGEDMFWGTAELVAREYAQHLAGASSVSGMQWVKASDGNFPTIRANYFLRHKYDDGRWHGWWMFVIPEIIDRQSWVRLGYEWLDESGASSLQAENERLREALEKILAMKEPGNNYAFNRCWHIAHEALNKQ